MKKDIAVTIPRSRISQVEMEEAEMARVPALGRSNYSYYWEMGRLPKEMPRRIYFLWEGAVRAYHDVLHMFPGSEGNTGKIYMTLDIHPVDPPVPMQSFRGFRYFNHD